MRDKLIKMSRDKYIETIKDLYCRYYLSCIDSISKFIMEIDVIKSSAKCAFLYKYYRPKLVESDKSFINVKELRHPIIEQLLKNEGNKYIHNSIIMDENNSYLIYGVNSVGKSSFLKSIALCVIMAQSGLFVSCKELNLSVYKSIFSRIGNNDNLFLNHSSFVNEIVESREIINKSNKNSLIIADELCASTEINSAIKIVSSIIKILSENRASFIFATHIFKLYDLRIIRELKNVKFKHLKVRFEDRLIFDRRLIDGLPENRQYGSIVALKIIKNDKFSEIMNRMNNFVEYSDEKEEKELVNKEFSKYNKKLVLDKCQICRYIPNGNMDIPLETHHIDMQCKADDMGYHEIYHKNELHNLVVLCKKCHQKVHQDKIINLKYVYTEKGKELRYNENIEKNKVKESKKIKKKYSEDMVDEIKKYYFENSYKTKEFILKEIRKNENTKKLSNNVFNKIINDNYF